MVPPGIENNVFLRNIKLINVFFTIYYSVFGKFGEDVKNRETVHVIKDEELFRKRVAKSNYFGTTIMSQDCAIVRMKKVHAYLDRPVYLTGVVLDKSKYLMNDFWYNHLKKAFNLPPAISLTLQMSDTDSFIFTVKTPVGSSSDFIWKQMATISNALDISAYDERHPLFAHNPDRRDFLLAWKRECKGKLGLFKDEMGNGLVQSGVFLRPKMYSLEAYDYHTPSTHSTVFEIQRLKGMSRSVVAKEINHSQYVRCLESEIPKRHTMTIIKCRKHELYIEQLTKTSLSIFDDKRRWLSKYVSVPYGL